MGDKDIQWEGRLICLEMEPSMTLAELIRKSTEGNVGGNCLSFSTTKFIGTKVQLPFSFKMSSEENALIGICYQIGKQEVGNGNIIFNTKGQLGGHL